MSIDAEQKSTLGKYTLERKLAQGGMAEIFLASQEGPGGFHKQLVIKRILPHLADDKKFVEMFLDEARIAAQFNNANIVQIYDLGEVDGTYFIAMEYIDGNDLSEIIERAMSFGKRVPPPIAARIIADALQGLHYAHEFCDPRSGEPFHLVHRDISPQNLLVNKDGVVKLVDFGVAKARTSQTKTQTGAVKGKFSYMAPEQIAGGELDGRCDIFAMGIVFYELLLGVRPFGTQSDLMAITAIVHQPPKNPREIDEQFPEELEAILYRALAKNRDERYASGLEMARDLEMYLQRSGVFISTREVSTYLADLFSSSPNLDAIGLGAGATHQVSLEELKARSTGPNVATDQTVAAVPGKTQRPKSQTPAPARPPFEPEEKKGLGGLLIAVIIIAILVIGGGGALAYLMFAGGDEAKTAEATGKDTAAKPPEVDAASAKDEPDVASAETPDAGAVAAQPDVAQDTRVAVAAADTQQAAPDVEPDTGNEPAADDSVEGEPVSTVVTTADIANIKVENLPGVSAGLSKGFGEVRITSNMQAKILYKGSSLGTTPRTLGFPAGDHEVKLVGKKEKADKVISVHVFDGRKYEVNHNFEKGSLLLVTNPADGLEIQIDGTKIGKTPIGTVDLWEGQHDVEISGKGKKRMYSLTVLPKVENKRVIRVR